ncbi:MAG: sugar hydrolase, partial [Lachnospiraceae bacterium]|nr:sugar hydrolase [Lachnospiraceae bacterium]
MASFDIMDRFEIHKNEKFLKIADECIPPLKEQDIKAALLEGDAAEMGKGDSAVFDLGDHYVGYISLRLGYTGSHPDAPLFIKVRFAERLREFEDDPDEYDGWISRSWIQEEWIHVDVLPFELKLARRYACRYIRVEVIDTSQKYKASIEEVAFKAVSAVSMEDITLPDCKAPKLNEIVRASAYTLKECMQQVFEDGPKRDRRLWLGDLRLQAGVNYITFKRTDLVKRCLYLFAGLPFNDDRISACLFTEPECESDDTFLF